MGCGDCTAYGAPIGLNPKREATRLLTAITSAKEQLGARKIELPVEEQELPEDEDKVPLVRN